MIRAFEFGFLSGLGALLVGSVVWTALDRRRFSGAKAPALP